MPHTTMGKAKARSKRAKSRTAQESDVGCDILNLFLPVLMQHCHSSVVDEYNALPAAAKVAMLDALRNAVRQLDHYKLLNEVDKFMQRTCLGRDKKKKLGPHESEDKALGMLAS